MVIAFTGHRPPKLGGYNWTNPRNKEIMNITYKVVKELVGKEPARIIAGGALGYDQFAFQAMTVLKSRFNPNLILEVAVPFKLQYSNWIKESRDTYFEQLEKADTVTYVDTLPRYQLRNTAPGVYVPAKMQRRNEYMVDQADVIVACWDGSSGGTGNCVHYAEQKNKRIINIYELLEAKA